MQLNTKNWKNKNISFYHQKILKLAWLPLFFTIPTTAALIFNIQKEIIIWYNLLSIIIAITINQSYQKHKKEEADSKWTKNKKKK